MIYEDRLATVELAPRACTHGHVLVRPQRAVKRLCELDAEEASHLFLLASYTAAILFQGIQAEGTNIIANEDEERLTLHVVARKQDDGLDFLWTPTPGDPAAMDDVLGRIRDALAGGPPVEEAAEAAPEEHEIRQAEDEENYLIKQLHRIP